MIDKKLVVIGGIHYPLTMMRYFIEAFEDRDDVDVWTYGPFTGNRIPWNGGMTLDQKYVKTPNFPLPESSINQRVPVAFIDPQVPKKADLWIDIDAGWCSEGRPNKAEVYVQVQTDPHVLKDRYRSHRGQYDYSFCMQTPYIEASEIYLPYAFSRRYHFPEEQEKIYDVCLIGLNYTHRASLMNRLQAEGLRVKSGIGIVFDDYRHEYNKSKIALSWSSLNDTPARVWEALGMGLPLVTNRLPDIDKFFVEGIHYEGFSSEDEAIDRIKHLLMNPQSSARMATNGRNAVMNDHSWDERAEEIMKVCGVL